MSRLPYSVARASRRASQVSVHCAAIFSCSKCPLLPASSPIDTPASRPRPLRQRPAAVARCVSRPHDPRHDPGEQSRRLGPSYWPLEHADWFGWTPTDLVFPFFLFIVGTSLAYSLRKYRARRRNRCRCLLADRAADDSCSFCLGWAWACRTACSRICSAMRRRSSFSNLRYPGVLQRIALVYFAASLIVLHLGVRVQVVLAAVLLFGLLGTLGLAARSARLPGESLARWQCGPHRRSRGARRKPHVYVNAATETLSEQTDPEGLLSTLPAIVTALLGYWTGLVIQRRGANGRTVVLLVGVRRLCFRRRPGMGHWFPDQQETLDQQLRAPHRRLGHDRSCRVPLEVRRLGLAAAGPAVGDRRRQRDFRVRRLGPAGPMCSASSRSAATSVPRLALQPTVHFLDQPIRSSPRWLSLWRPSHFWWLILWAMSRRGWSVRV